MRFHYLNGKSSYGSQVLFDGIIKFIVIKSSFANGVPPQHQTWTASTLIYHSYAGLIKKRPITGYVEDFAFLVEKARRAGVRSYPVNVRHQRVGYVGNITFAPLSAVKIDYRRIKSPRFDSLFTLLPLPHQRGVIKSNSICASFS